jgi:hypothetical protein
VPVREGEKTARDDICCEINERDVRKFCSEAVGAALVTRDERGEKARSVECEDDEEEDQGENKTGGPKDATGGNKSFDAGVFIGNGVRELQFCERNDS